jgi:hypothetical protein
MVVPYRVEGDSFRAEKPRPWSDGRYGRRPRPRSLYRPFDLHPDGNRFAVGPYAAAIEKQDHLVLIFNFFDELRRIAPSTQR